MPITRNRKSRWKDIPEMRAECMVLCEQGLLSPAIVAILNKKYKKQLTKLGYGPINRNMVLGEKHREAIMIRRQQGLTVPRQKGNRVYFVKAEPVVKQPPPFKWMTSPLFDTIRVKPNNGHEAQMLEDIDE